MSILELFDSRDNKKRLSLLIVMLIPIFCFPQTNWSSGKYRYSIEIPSGFAKTSPVGANVDFKAVKGQSSIVIVVTTIPKEYSHYSLWEILGDLETFGLEWELGAREHMNNPKFLKYGTTTLSGLSTFWYDYTTDNPKMYSKTYQTKKGDKLYTITLTCPHKELNQYSAVWLRFKDKMKIE